MSFSGMLRRVALVRTDVSEVHITSIVRMERIPEDCILQIPKYYDEINLCCRNLQLELSLHCYIIPSDYSQLMVTI
jgi:hypothetical protein